MEYSCLIQLKNHHFLQFGVTLNNIANYITFTKIENEAQRLTSFFKLPHLQDFIRTVRQVSTHGPRWQRSGHRCSPQLSNFSHVDPQVGTFTSQETPLYSFFPQGQVLLPRKGQSPQGPEWHPRSHLCFPQASKLSQGFSH